MVLNIIMQPIQSQSPPVCREAKGSCTLLTLTHTIFRTPPPEDEYTNPDNAITKEGMAAKKEKKIGSSPEQHCLMFFFDFMFTAKCVHPGKCRLLRVYNIESYGT